ncbi:MAG: DUF2784 domain-containing protein [Caulobacterales bacterium]
MPGGDAEGIARWRPNELRGELRPDEELGQAHATMANPEVQLAGAVLMAHLAVIAFNVFGLAAIPIGGWLKWRFVRVRWWRLLHLGSMAAVAVQAVAGRSCFLTVLEDRLAGQDAASTPLIMGLVNRVIFWPLPLWAFSSLYVLLFLYVIILFWLVPLDRRTPAAGKA